VVTGRIFSFQSISAIGTKEAVFEKSNSGCIRACERVFPWEPQPKVPKLSTMSARIAQTG
jgi:hypothetical protein